MINKHLTDHGNTTANGPQTVLITGADSQLAKALQRRSSTIAQAFRLIPLTREQLDISDALVVAKAFSEYRPDWVINCAAYNGVDDAEREPELAYRVNSLGPELLAKQCVNLGARLVHISSDYVFNGGVFSGEGISGGAFDCDVVSSDTCHSHKTSPYRETDSPSPLSVYGKSKLAGENAVLGLLGERALVIRTAWLYGQDGHNFVKTMLKLMQTQASLTVIDDQIGSPTWSDALAHTVWQLILKQGQGMFHYAGLGECSWYHFACEIQRQALQFKLLTKQIPIVPIDSAGYAAKALMQGKSLALRPSYSALCSEKLQHFMAMPELQTQNLQNNQDLLMSIVWQDWRQQLKIMLQSM
ncbi:dTDP-4-dehydrorhamnose reductase [Shewanella sp. HN-41]|uniref:dTDP-4-dehydrorhamnose reductase n=1 Tax=Shewanella sp. HN-41 TaxID=327275 RepID=UPI0002125A27|nr:dTDP-4-dehydrorhamnose reductase [Shewanella sp. HN-41]EGM70630.1 dTDP-4-dehydrorhamnose reductase [Shewanella sp. HN-41]